MFVPASAVTLPAVPVWLRVMAALLVPIELEEPAVRLMVLPATASVLVEVMSAVLMRLVMLPAVMAPSLSAEVALR